MHIHLGKRKFPGCDITGPNRRSLHCDRRREAVSEDGRNRLMESRSSDNDNQDSSVAESFATALADTQPSDAPSISADGETMTSNTNGLPSNFQAILIGSVAAGAFVFLVLTAVITWRIWQKRATRNAKSSAFSDAMEFERPSRRYGLLARVPVLRKIFGVKEWYTIEHHTPEVLEKQRYSYSCSLDKPRWSPETPRYSFDPPPSYPDPSISGLEKPSATYQTVSLPRSNTQLSSEPSTPTTLTEKTAVRVEIIARHTPNRPSPLDLAQLPRHKSKRGKHQSHASTLSSVSSGFGDGDIVLTPNGTARMTGPRLTTVPPSRKASHRSHLSHRSYRSSRRDTTSTVATQDNPPDIEAVSSWLHQQKGHMRTAQQKRAGEDSVPPVPVLSPPPEQDFRFMRPDDQSPRRVDMPK